MHTRFLTFLICLLLSCSAGLVRGAISETDAAAALREKYASLEEQLQHNQFKRPLVLESTETPKRLKGDVYAIIDYPFAAVSAGLNNPDHWCDVMLLHINTKYCRAVAAPAGTTLRVNIGKKTQEELADAARMDFRYQVVTATADYVAILLDAKEGPMGTSDYRIMMESVSLPNAKSFLHLTYSYSMNLPGRLALQTYLGTVGASKVGFTVTGKRADGQPIYIGGVRGMVERNTMRYYLAFESFLEAAGAAPPSQPEKRMQSWFTAVERYPRQLHEMDRREYIEMKRAEYLRQQTEY